MEKQKQNSPFWSLGFTKSKIKDGMSSIKDGLFKILRHI